MNNLNQKQSWNLYEMKFGYINVHTMISLYAMKNSCFGWILKIFLKECSILE